MLKTTLLVSIALASATAFRATKVPVTDDLVKRLRVPPGHTVTLLARDLGDARMLAVTPAGTILVTCPGEGQVLALSPDGTKKRAVITGLENVHGIALSGDRLLVATPTHVYETRWSEDATTLTPRPIISDLPSGGQHPNRTLAFGPDGQLYISVGSTCNACEEPDREHAVMLKATPDGRSRTVWAKGLRNTIGFGWHPTTKQMWGMDHGSDNLGDDLPPEELNLLTEGSDYGWPWAYGDRQVDPIRHEPKKGPSKAERAKATRAPVLTYQAHSAPIAMVFDARGDAYVAFHGSWNRARSVGYEVARIRFENGKPTKFEPFLTGFLLEGGKKHFARPAGLAIAKDGALLVSDDANGALYRVAPPAR